MALLADDISINTVVGAGTKVSGDLNIAGLVRIDGDIDGNLETTGRIIIGEKARIHGNVTAKAAVIQRIELPAGENTFNIKNNNFNSAYDSF